MFERGAQCVAPAAGNTLIHFIFLFDPAFQPRLKGIVLINQQIKRQTARQIGPDGRIERNEQKLHSILETHVGLVGAHQYRFSVFCLADLEKRCFFGNLDEIPRWQGAVLTCL